MVDEYGANVGRIGHDRTRIWRVLIAVAGFSFPLSFWDALAFPLHLSLSPLLAGLLGAILQFE